MTEWIITCKVNDYNIEGAFSKLDTIDWRQSTYVEKGDIVYIYVGAPVSAIRYKCEAVEVELPESTIDDSEFVLDGSNYENGGRYMRLHLLAKYDNPLLVRHQLVRNGLKTVQGPSKANLQLSSYLFSVTETGGNVFDHFYSNKGVAPKTRREAITILQRAYNRPVTARELTDIMYEIGKQQANVFSELTFMEQRGLVIKSGSLAPYGYSVVSNLGDPQYFYVFQNQSYEEESKGEYLQAPKQAKDGTENHHWSRLKEVKKGDVIFHGYKQHVAAVSIAKTDAYTIELSEENGTKEGWRVDVSFYAFIHSIAPKDYWEDIKLLLPEKYSPFDKNGSGNMGYLFPISQELARYFLDATAGKQVRVKAISTESETMEAEEKEDRSLIEELKLANVGIADGFEYNGEPKEKAAPVYTNGHKTYPRDRQTAINALAHANYACEIDVNHPTFIRKKWDKKYTEPHHLVPMAFSDEFDVSLDVEENIVSLCSNCHNQIHYGKDADVLLRKLYEERKDALASVGMKITLSRLLHMYGYEG